MNLADRHRVRIAIALSLTFATIGSIAHREHPRAGRLSICTSVDEPPVPEISSQSITPAWGECPPYTSWDACPAKVRREAIDQATGFHWHEIPLTDGSFSISMALPADPDQ
jgi:hypothetical protein